MNIYHIAVVILLFILVLVNLVLAIYTNNLLKEDDNKNSDLSKHENSNLDICEYCENKSVCDKCIYKDSKD